MEQKEFEQRYNYIVVKNKDGHRKQMKISDYNEFQKNPVKGHPLYGYGYDLDWYLAQGCKEINQMFNDIENGYYSDKQD